MKKIKITPDGIVEENLTAEEITAAQTQDNSAFYYALENLRLKRNDLLKKCDWVMMSDSPIADKTTWETYRTQLRNITNGLTTVEDVNGVTFPSEPN